MQGHHDPSKNQATKRQPKTHGKYLLTKADQPPPHAPPSQPQNNLNTLNPLGLRLLQHHPLSLPLLDLRPLHLHIRIRIPLLLPRRNRLIKALVLAMGFVVIGPLLGFEVIRKLRQHDVADGGDRGVEIGAAVPDGDVVAVETAGEGEAAEVVAWMENGFSD